MKCPQCAAWTEVLETRITESGKRRRYQCANKHRFTTKEQIVEQDQSRVSASKWKPKEGESYVG